MAKGPEAFRSISEASVELGAPQHVLRFWETKFSFVRPMKRAGGRRFYRPHDIAILAAVHRLLHEEGYTIKGVQKLHREGGLKALLPGDSLITSAPQPTGDCAAGAKQVMAGPETNTRHRLKAALAGLQAAKMRLDALLGGSNQGPD